MCSTLNHYHRVNNGGAFCILPRNSGNYLRLLIPLLSIVFSPSRNQFGKKGLPVTVVFLSSYHESLQNSSYKSRGAIPGFYAPHTLATLEFALKQD